MLLLQNDATSLVVTPEHGGAIVGWVHHAVPVLRRPIPDAILRGDAVEAYRAALLHGSSIRRAFIDYTAAQSGEKGWAAAE